MWTRRALLRDTFCGFGSLALASLLHQEEARANPLAPKRPHLPGAKAQAVIFLFMAGGPSHLETFDPKPLLNRLHGQPRPAVVRIRHSCDQAFGLETIDELRDVRLDAGEPFGELTERKRGARLDQMPQGRQLGDG